MGLVSAITTQLRPATQYVDAVEVVPEEPQGIAHEKGEKHDADVDIEVQKPVALPVVESGVARVEAVQAVWGKHGRYVIIAGIAMMMIM